MTSGIPNSQNVSFAFPLGWLFSTKMVAFYSFTVQTTEREDCQEGGVEPGETWGLAAIRECKEKTSWLVRIVELFGVFSDPETQADIYPNVRTVHFMCVVFRAGGKTE